MRLLAVLFVFAACVMSLGCQSGGSCCAEEGAGVSLYRHVVLFKFKDSATAANVKAVEDAFGKLPDQIDTIRAFEFGTNVSPEGKADGFTHCFLVSFDNKAGLEKYLPHPAHQEFVKVLRPHLDKVLVIDYIAGC